MIAEDIQSKVGTLEFIAPSLRTLSNPSHRNGTTPLTDEVFHRLFIKLPPRIPPPGEQLSHPLELGPCRSQIEEVSPSRVTDLFRGFRSGFEANSNRHEFEKLVEARGPFRGIESPA